MCEQVKCPYCGRVAEFMSSQLFYGQDYGSNVYVCRRCDAYVGTHGRSKRPMGSLANEELRTARKRAHSMFDLMWQRGHMTRSAAYRLLATSMKIPPEKAHIGMFNLEQCDLVWLAALRFFLMNGEIEDCPDCQGSGDAGYPERIEDYNPCTRCNGLGWIQRIDLRVV